MSYKGAVLLSASCFPDAGNPNPNALYRTVNPNPNARAPRLTPPCLTPYLLHLVWTPPLQAHTSESWRPGALPASWGEGAPHAPTTGGLPYPAFQTPDQAQPLQS